MLPCPAIFLLPLTSSTLELSTATCNYLLRQLNFVASGSLRPKASYLAVFIEKYFFSFHLIELSPPTEPRFHVYSSPPFFPPGAAAAAAIPAPNPCSLGTAIPGASCIVKEFIPAYPINIKMVANWLATRNLIMVCDLAGSRL